MLGIQKESCARWSNPLSLSYASVSRMVLALCRDPSPFAGSAEREPLAPAAHSRQEVGMVLDSVLQLLQEGQVCGLPRTQTLFILQGIAQGDKHRGHHTRSNRHRRKGQSLGSPDRACRLGQNLTLPSPAPHTAPADTLGKESGKASLLPPNMRLEEQTTYQDGDDALELLLHQVTDDLVVEILDRFPLHRVRRAAIRGLHTLSWEPQGLASHDMQGAPGKHVPQCPLLRIPPAQT